MSSTHYQTAPEDRISLRQKSAYAVGMLVNNLQAAALPAMVVILNLGLGMDVLLVGLISAIPRVFDAISDPMLGYISDNTRSRWGRRRPFIFVGAILAGLLFAVMWQLPSGYVDLMAGRALEKEALPGVMLELPLWTDVPADLREFPQLELNLETPPARLRQVVLTEAGGESFVFSLEPGAAEDENGRLFRFDLEAMRSQQGTSGDRRLDAGNVGSISLRMDGVEEAGLVTVRTLKFMKSESFFTKYFWYFLSMSVLFFLAYTVYATPFVAFGYEMTPDYHERTRLHAFANWVGQLAWLGVPWFYKIMASDLFDDKVHGARTLAVAVGIFVALGGIVPAIFCRERELPATRPDSGKTPSFAQNMKEFGVGIAQTFRCLPFVKLCGATFLVFNGFQLGMSFSIYVMIYYLFAGDDGQAGTLLGTFGSATSLATLAVIPLTAWIGIRLGKRRTFLLTISLSMLGYALKWVGYNPEHPYWLIIAAPLVAFGTGSLFTLMGSMISDVCDYDELQTGKRREGVFGSIYWWMVKVGMALAGLLTGVLLKFAGFDEALGSGQAEQTLVLLRVFDVGIPFITSAIALGIIATYAISEERANEIRAQLEARRGKISA